MSVNLDMTERERNQVFMQSELVREETYTKHIDDLDKQYAQLPASVDENRNKIAILTDDLGQTNAQLSTKADYKELLVERARIDTFTKLTDGSTTGDAELIDARIGSDGIIYPNVGNAIRNQIENNKNIDLSLNINYEDGYVTPSGGIGSAPTGFKHKQINIYGYDVLNIKDTCVYGADGFSFYTKDMVHIQHFTKSDFNGSKYMKFNVPENSHYIKIGAHENDDVFVGVEIYNVINAVNHGVLENSNKIDACFNKNDGVGFQDVINLTNEIYNMNTLTRWYASNYVVENGVASFSYSNSSGNVGFQTGVISTKDNFINVEIDVLTLTGTGLKLYVSGNNKDTNNVMYLSHTNITTTGTYKCNIDLNYYEVYNNLDLTTAKLIFANIGVMSISMSRISIYEDFTSNIGIAGNDLIETLLNIERRFNSLDNNNGNGNVASCNNTLISPNGSKFVLNVSDDGVLGTTPIIPDKTLFIGNSLLIGHGTFGMCATSSKGDYYYHVSQYIKSLKPSAIFEKRSGTSFEGSTTQDSVDNYLDSLQSSIQEKKFDLIIIQLGDNVNTSDKLSIFKNSCKQMIQAIQYASPKSRICWVGEWYYTTEKQNIIKQACMETGAIFIDITSLTTTEYKGKIGDVVTRDDGTTFVVETSGAASHPSDLGMKAIADTMIERLFL